MYKRYRLLAVFKHIMQDVDRGAWTYPENYNLNALSNPLSLLKRCSDALAHAQMAGGKTASIKWAVQS